MNLTKRKINLTKECVKHTRYALQKQYFKLPPKTNVVYINERFIKSVCFKKAWMTAERGIVKQLAYFVLSLGSGYPLLNFGVE